MVYGTYETIVTGVYKPTNITGGPHIVGISLVGSEQRWDDCVLFLSITNISVRLNDLCGIFVYTSWFLQSDAPTCYAPKC